MTLLTDRDVQAVAEQERQVPTAEEERREQRARRDDRDVLREENIGELHAGVLGEVAGDDFALTLRQIEGNALRFGDRRREEQEERERLDEDAPGVFALPAHHLVEPERARTPSSRRSA